MIIDYDVVPGIHRIEHAWTNCYVVEDGDGVTIVDAAFPSTAGAVQRVLNERGRGVSDIRALLLTHGHFDHVGFAAGLQRQRQVPIWVHTADVQLARHPYRYRPERNRVAFPIGHPRGLPILGSMVAAGALAVRGVQADRQFRDREILDVPGRPQVLHVPGHTAGQCAFWFEDRDAALVGDALVTLDPYTGRRGPRLVARAATADSAQAYASLGRLRGVDASVVLSGHGPVWRAGLAAAVSDAEATEVG